MPFFFFVPKNRLNKCFKGISPLHKVCYCDIKDLLIIIQQIKFWFGLVGPRKFIWVPLNIPRDREKDINY